MQFFKEREKSKAKSRLEKFSAFYKEFPHFPEEEFYSLPISWRYQILLSNFSLILSVCPEISKYLSELLSLPLSKRVELYSSLLYSYNGKNGHENNGKQSNDCFSLLSKYLLEDEEQSKIEEAIALLEKGEINTIEELYRFLPASLYVKLAMFEKYVMPLYKDKRTALLSFLKKQRR